MTGRDLLEDLSFIEARFVDEAETAWMLSQKAQKGPERRFSAKKGLLIAVAAAMMLALVGCAVAYVMHMKDFRVGYQETNKPVYSEYNTRLEGYAPVKEQVLTLSGLEGSPGFRAAKEWYEFKKGYDPERQMQYKLLEQGTVPQFPAEYDAYDIYTQEMKDALDEILKTYSLKPAGERLEFRTVRNLYDALGVATFLETEGEVTVAGDGGGCYANGNFWLNLRITVPTDKESQILSTTGVLRWNRKDCFSEDMVTIEETDDWEEWNCTMASGRTALILRSHTDARGWILCDRGEGILAQQVIVRRDTGEDGPKGSWWKSEFMSNRQLETIAEVIDESVEPRLVSREDADHQPRPSYEATQNGYTLKLKKIHTDGYAIRVTIGITAPEGTVISRNTREGQETMPYQIRPANFLDELTPASGASIQWGGTWSPQEDGDGQDNTQDMVLFACASIADGPAPFAPGCEWNLRIENLVTNYLTENNDYMQQTLAEGEWLFPITIREDDGDFREVELLTEPITVKAAVRDGGDGTDGLEDREITSFRLRTYTADISCEDENISIGNIAWVNGRVASILMKDGQVFSLDNGRPEPIDLDQVDYVLLTDGTKIPMPEQGE